jgi:hypothetical protein
MERLKRDNRALRRTLAMMLDEFAGYSNDIGNADEWREPKSVQNARALLKRLSNRK